MVERMCKWGTWKKLKLKIPADLSSTGKEKWKMCKIDSCIADIVEALQNAGIDMRGCCCGHGKDLGDIHLQDGRVLVITDDFFCKSRLRWVLKILAKELYQKIQIYYLRRIK